MDIQLALDSFRYDNEECWFEMIVKATEFPSVNSMYGINTKTKHMFLLPHVIQMKNELKDQLIFTDPKKHCPWITDRGVYFRNFTFILKRQFWSRDLDNCIKAVQDVIFECLNVNDARIVENREFKNFKSGDYEYLIFRVGLSLYPYNQFNI